MTIESSLQGDLEMLRSMAMASDRDVEGSEQTPESEKAQDSAPELSLARRSTYVNGCCVRRILLKIE